MILCPSCQHAEYVGTLFCGECGTALIADSQTSLLEIGVDEVQKQAMARSMAEPVPLVGGKDLRAGLRLLTTGELVTLSGLSSFTLGRAVAGQAIVPDVDLDAYGASQCGVSRIHAEVTFRGRMAHLKDLESSNGTWLNGEQLSPNDAKPLHHGDIIQLGSLGLQLIMPSQE